MALTEIAIKAAALPEGKKKIKLSDSGGLQLVIVPSGKYWRMAYRWQGTQQELSLGVYPQVSLKEARTLRDQARAALATGANPREAIKRRTHAQGEGGGATATFEAVASEWLAKRRRDGLADATAIKTESILRRWLCPAIGADAVADIDPVRLLDALRPIEEAGFGEVLHKAKVMAGQIFRFAIATGRRTSPDPTPSLRGALLVRRHTPTATILEPSRIGELLLAIDSYAGTAIVRHAIALLPHLFCRPGELRQMEWCEIDFSTARWELPASKMKMRRPHIVPLSRQALAILAGIQPLTGRGRYVFPALSTSKRPMSENTLNQALRRLGYGPDEITSHGFRAMARTHLEETLRYSPDLIEHQLAHEVHGPLGRTYNRTTHIEARAEMMQRWSDWLDEIRGG